MTRWGEPWDDEGWRYEPPPTVVLDDPSIDLRQAWTKRATLTFEYGVAFEIRDDLHRRMMASIPAVLNRLEEAEEDNERWDGAYWQLDQVLRRVMEERDQARAAYELVRVAIRTLHAPSTDHGPGVDPYCVGCWEAGGEDSAPSWPCRTVRMLDEH